MRQDFYGGNRGSDTQVAPNIFEQIHGTKYIDKRMSGPPE